MVDQLFKIFPDSYTLYKLLNCFGIKQLSHELLLITSNYNHRDIINKFIDLKPLLEKKYRKCKFFKIYENINFKKCITILRQILNIHDYKLIKVKKNYKFINVKLLRIQEKVLVTFD